MITPKKIMSRLDQIFEFTVYRKERDLVLTEQVNSLAREITLLSQRLEEKDSKFSITIVALALGTKLYDYYPCYATGSSGSIKRGEEYNITIRPIINFNEGIFVLSGNDDIVIESLVVGTTQHVDVEKGGVRFGLIGACSYTKNIVIRVKRS